MQPILYRVQEHLITRDQIDADARSVIERLKAAGFTAYAVGGCVRDLFLGKKPKDFDIATSARPEQVKKIFRSCLLIGRRFRLAQIRFPNRHIVEVATFRAGDTEKGDLIVRDNTWGTEEEDALRRDFTINGLFYDPDTETIIDYIEGVPDLISGTIRTIGDPTARFLQDPVRMMRLIKFQARFGLRIDPHCAQSLQECLHAIEQSSPARVLEELLRMLESGYSKKFFELASEKKILDHLLPDLSTFLRGRSKKRVFSYLEGADELILGENFECAREVLFASLIYPRIEWELQKMIDRDPERPPITPSEVFTTVSSLMQPMLSKFTNFPRRARSLISYILQYQLRITPLDSAPKTKKARFLLHADFQHVLDFLKIRSHLFPKLVPQYHYWMERFDRCKDRRKERDYVGKPPRRRGGGRRSSKDRHGAPTPDAA